MTAARPVATVPAPVHLPPKQFKVPHLSTDTSIDGHHTLIDLVPLRERARELVELARAAGADAADVVVAASRSAGVEVREGRVEDTEASENDAFSLRVMIGQRAASVSANRGGDARQLAGRAVAMARVSPENPYASLAPAERLARHWPDLDLADPAAPSRSAMVERALACEAAALAVPGVAKSSGASFGRSVSGAVLATSAGFEGAYQSTRSTASVSAIAGEGETMQRDYDFDTAHHLADLREVAAIGERAGSRAVARMNPRTVPSQPVPVLYEPRVARGLVNHMLAAMSGASVARGTSLFRERRGDRVAACGVTVLDEPHLPRGPASRPFDGEGMAMEMLTLIEDGVLNHFLLDTASARELDLEPNARGSRAGSGTTPTSTNAVLLPGARSPDEMIADMGTGLLVTELIGQGVNLVTGDYSRGASGFWIENGAVAYPVSEITVAGNLLEMLMHMEPASDLDRRFGTDAPSVLVEGLTVAGR